MSGHRWHVYSDEGNTLDPTVRPSQLYHPILLKNLQNQKLLDSYKIYHAGLYGKQLQLTNSFAAELGGEIWIFGQPNFFC